jgi:predicted nucleotidyltransferase
MGPLVSRHRAEIAEICQRFHVRRLDVFGSAARGADFRPVGSDADFLVEFISDVDSLTDFLDLQQALKDLLQRPIDLVDRRAVETSRNSIRRRTILGEAQPVYAA